MNGEFLRFSLYESLIILLSKISTHYRFQICKIMNRIKCYYAFNEDLNDKHLSLKLPCKLWIILLNKCINKSFVK